MSFDTATPTDSFISAAKHIVWTAIHFYKAARHSASAAMTVANTAMHFISTAKQFVNAAMHFVCTAINNSCPAKPICWPAIKNTFLINHLSLFSYSHKPFPQKSL
jgi:lipoate synthase